MILLPTWFPINIYRHERLESHDRRAAVDHVGLATGGELAAVARHSRTVSDEARDVAAASVAPASKEAPASSVGTMSSAGSTKRSSFCDRVGFRPLRKPAMQKAEQWMVDRFVGSDGLGAIFPPMVWSIIALRCLGYADDSPEMRYCLERLEGLIIEERTTARLAAVQVAGLGHVDRAASA